MSVEVGKEGRKGPGWKNEKQSSIVFSLSLLAQNQSRRTHRTTRGVVDFLLPARRGEESDKGRGVEEQQRRAASDDDDVVDAAVVCFQTFGYEGNVLKGFRSDMSIEDVLFVTSRRRKKAREQERGILKGDDDCHSNLSLFLASQRKEKRLFVFVFLGWLSARELFSHQLASCETMK